MTPAALQQYNRDALTRACQPHVKGEICPRQYQHVDSPDIDWLAITNPAEYLGRHVARCTALDGNTHTCINMLRNCWLPETHPHAKAVQSLYVRGESEVCQLNGNVILHTQ
jgi:hypothetical protein